MLASAECELPLKPTDPDIHPYLLDCLNGTVNALCGYQSGASCLTVGKFPSHNLGTGPRQCAPTFSHAMPQIPNDPLGYMAGKPSGWPNARIAFGSMPTRHSLLREGGACFWARHALREIGVTSLDPIV
jgi:hypothetical protein